MRYVEKTRTWKDNWNNIVRHVIFKDRKLKQLMLVPVDAPITQFVDKYFIEDETTDELITDEKVRVTYCTTKGYDTGNSNVKLRFLEFDIYVCQDELHTATSDRLQNRYDLIAERIKYLLLRHDRIEHMHYEYEDEYNLFTKVVGYRRYHLVFSFKVSI